MTEFRDDSGQVWAVSLDAGSGKIVFESEDDGRATDFSGHSLEDLQQEELRDLFLRSMPFLKVKAVRDFSADRHAFFDELIMLCAAYGSVLHGIGVHAGGPARPWGSHDGIAMQGATTSDLALTIMPGPILDALSQDRWPSEIRLIESSRADIPDPGGTRLTAVRRFSGLLGMGPFVWYFEREREKVANTFGGDPYQWPSVWNFARVIRNALVHNEGAIDFANSSATPVSWRGLEYGPADNGRQVMFVDLTAVELILLMEDMHDSLV